MVHDRQSRVQPNHQHECRVGHGDRERYSSYCHRRSSRHSCRPCPLRHQTCHPCCSSLRKNSSSYQHVHNQTNHQHERRGGHGGLERYSSYCHHHSSHHS